MLRKIIAILLTIMMLPCAMAEEADENPFLGVWKVLYYIIDGSIHTPEELDYTEMVIINEDGFFVRVGDVEDGPRHYEIAGDTMTCGTSVFRLEGKDLLVCEDNDMSVLLVRVDPIVLNNPFIGEWKVLYIQDGGTILDILEYATSIGMTIPTTGEFVMPVTFDASTFTLNNQLYACSYADGACTIYDDDEIEAICTIGEDGLLHIVNPEDADYAVVCVRTDEVASEDISRFYGLWREIALIYDGVLVTDQQPSGLLFQFDFSRGLVRRTCDMIPDFPAFLLRVIYQDGDCKILYDDAPALCTIDANGMMCIRSENGNGVSWLVRVQKETPAEAPADIE